MTARFLYRRQFIPRLVRIVGDAVRRRDTRDAVFVSLMGGLGDLVNAFPTLDRLGQRSPVDLGTGGGAYRALAGCARSRDIATLVMWNVDCVVPARRPRS